MNSITSPFYKYLIVFLLLFSQCKEKSAVYTPIKNIDFDWSFSLGDFPEAKEASFDDSNWRILDLPHDWSIEGEYAQDHGTDWQTGFLPAGIGWYRKTFDVNENWIDKQIFIDFDGVYTNSTVYINGIELGFYPNGYLGFSYELTPHLKKGENVIAVKVDHSKPLSGRWYTGSGIYRHVWLRAENKTHIAKDGVYFNTDNVSSEKADFSVSTQIHATEISEVNYVVVLKKLSGEEIFRRNKIVAMNENIQTLNLDGSINNPDLWSPDSPIVYNLKTSILSGKDTLDVQSTVVGFRKLEFDGSYGFKLNDQLIKFKGLCEHHTAGAVGSAIPDDVLYRRLKILKNMGANAIRTSHNPFSPEFYAMCDTMGIMVMDEIFDGWDSPKMRDDYGNYFKEWWQNDVASFLRRDRNHPSIIIWSIGNEVRKPTRKVQKELIDLFHEMDPTRPVTQGGHDPTRGMTGENLPTQLDIKGFNGDGEEIGVFENFHNKNLKTPMIGTEVPHTYQTRGVYRTKTNWRRRDFPAKWELQHKGNMGSLINRVFPISDLSEEEAFPEEQTSQYYKNGEYFPIQNDAPWVGNLYYQSSYDNASVRSSLRKAWQRTRDLDYVMGQFRWGSFDYLGESNDWPSRFANFGVIDMAGFPKDHFYLLQSLWTEEPMVHLLPHWTHTGKEGVEIPMVVYTNCDEAELFLNGKSLGKKIYEDEQLVWMVPFAPGTIKVEASQNGKIVAKKEFTTASDASTIRLKTDKSYIKANRRDVVHIELDITDRDGVFCPYADNEIEFEVTGPAKIIGTDNGDPLDLSNYKTNKRKAFRGKVLLIIQATDESGEIVITAKSKNIQESSIRIIAN